MSYKTYTTDAIVCGSRERGAADKTYWLFTRDAGMVIARAKSVREMRSKLRYGLQDFGLSKVSLVRGKHDWTITGVDSMGNLFLDARSREGRAVLLRSVKLLRRMLTGEEAHPRLFAVVREGLRSFAEGDVVAAPRERVFMLRMLHALGYIAHDATWTSVIEAPTLEEACAHAAAPEVDMSIGTAVNAALRASQL